MFFTECCRLGVEDFRLGAEGFRLVAESFKLGAEGFRLGIICTLLSTSMRSWAMQVLNMASDLGIVVHRQVWTSTLEYKYEYECYACQKKIYQQIVNK